MGGNESQMPKCFVCVCVSHHIRECFYCTSGLTHIPGVIWGRLVQDGEDMWAEL